MEGPKDLLVDRAGDAPPVVRHVEGGVLSRPLAPDAHPEPRCLRVVGQGVRHEIAEDVGEGEAVGAEIAQVPLDRERDVAARRGGAYLVEDVDHQG